MIAIRWLGPLVLSWMLAACNDAGPAAARPEPARAAASAPQGVAAAPFKVALIMKSLNNPFFIEMETGARRAQQESGVNLQVQSTSQETSIEQQIQLVERQIRAGAQAIVIAPGDSTRLVAVLKKAQDAGIKIINIDNRLDPATVKAKGLARPPFISVDNDRAAYLAAKYLADRINRPSEVAVFEGVRTADNAGLRKRGAMRAFAENSKLRVVASESANWDPDEAYEVAKRVFAANPKLAAVFCANDMMALGVIKYLQDTGNNKVLVTGFDALDDAKQAVRTGKLVATVDQQAGKQGYEGVMAAIKALRGEPVPDDVWIDALLVTADTLK